MWKYNESLLYQLNAYILNRPCAVICWIGNHENEFDAILSVADYNIAELKAYYDFVARMIIYFGT